MTHFVFDTNVIVSALLFNDSGPGRAFFRALNYGTILISRPLVKELSEVLCRGKFDRYISHEERDKFLEALITESDLIETTESVHVCRDPEDNQVLELAVNGNATFIVTGDTYRWNAFIPDGGLTRVYRQRPGCWRADRRSIPTEYALRPHAGVAGSERKFPRAFPRLYRYRRCFGTW